MIVPEDTVFRAVWRSLKLAPGELPTVTVTSLQISFGSDGSHTGAAVVVLGIVVVTVVVVVVVDVYTIATSVTFTDPPEINPA